jgi:hypothetical protein
LEAFRTQTEKVADKISYVHKPSAPFESDSDAELVGLEAKIPGGRFDPDLSASLQAQADRLGK